MSELPKGWARAPLATLLVEGPTNGYSPSSPADATGTLTLRLSATTTGRFILTEQTTKRFGEQVPLDSKLWLVPGDILVQRANTLEYVGTAAIYDGPAKTYVYPDLMMRLRVRVEAVDSAYLTRFLNSTEARGHLRERATGTAGNMPKINGATLRELPVVVPPLPEQRRIVATLDDLLARSRRAKEALDAISPLLDKLRQSVLAAAFRGDLTADWREKNAGVEPAEKLLARIRVERRKKWEETELAKMKAKGKVPGDDRWKEKYVEPEPVDTHGLPELPEGWCWTTIETVGHLLLGRRRAQNEYVEGEDGRVLRPYLRVANVKEDRLDFSDVFTMPFSPDELEVYTLERGDIILSEGQSPELVGQSAIYDGGHDDLCIQATVHRFRPYASGVSTEYAQLAFLNNRHQGVFKRASSLTTNIAHLTSERLKPLPFPLAPAEEQPVLVARARRALQVAHAGRERCELAKRELARTQRAILAKAFRGELVPQDPNDEPAEVMLARLKAEASTDTGRSGAPARRRKATAT